MIGLCALALCQLCVLVSDECKVEYARSDASQATYESFALVKGLTLADHDGVLKLITLKTQRSKAAMEVE